MRSCLVLVFIVCCRLAQPAPSPSAGSGQDWPQLQCNSARTGWTPDSPAPPYEVAYALQFGYEEPLGQQMQPIVYRDVMYIPTMRGRLYAFKPETGERLWVAQGYGLVMGSAAASDGMVFTAGLDGIVRAAKADSGEAAWESDLGFGISASPCVDSGRLYIGTRRGDFFCLDTATGGTVWKIALPDYVWQSAAIADARVYIATDGEIRLYCLDANDGGIVWNSGHLPGMYCRDYYPVVSAGRVWLTVCPAEYNFIIEDKSIFPYSHWFGDDEKDLVKNYFAQLNKGVLPGDIKLANENMAAEYERDPLKQHMFCFDARTGERPFVVGYKRLLAGMCHAAPPPAADSEGMMNVAVSFCSSRVGRIDPATGRIADIAAGAIVDMARVNSPDGFGTNSDEGHAVSCGGSRVFWQHYDHGNCDTSLMYDVKSRDLIALPRGVHLSKVIMASLEPREEYFRHRYGHWTPLAYPRLAPRICVSSGMTAPAVWRNFLFKNGGIAFSIPFVVSAVRGSNPAEGDSK